MSERFGTSARKAENGFVRRQIVSSKRPRRNIRGEKAWNFNVRKIREEGFDRTPSSRERFSEFGVRGRQNALLSSRGEAPIQTLLADDVDAACSVIASEAKQSRVLPRRDSGLLRFARNDDVEAAVPPLRLLARG
ncbi:hypothetical protein NLM27_30840 [Bradyrhizobium sp. CCGB12]|uniref:hypothetical protein n=1 Tax=Bradyrhizobium sp. CCGB12 TaxID=2949632 RepID=UPI0020B274FC|nr:hypothetical protein [Bradyrhizobium sp. CCGB12]MCP3393154.1 hypothetical protein [Bradyrhizobium sp. CCGB12]